jgi:arsenate reductase (thioredoxin)
MSAFLMFVILAVATDTRAVGEAAAIAIGGTIGLDAMFGGPITGASMNPMRLLGPALVSGELHALWVYLTAPVLGASLGGLAYQFVRGRADAAGRTASRRRPEGAGGVNVLFVCVANSGRSVMAERILREIAHGRHDARSAGSEPGGATHPQVVEALREIGIDVSDHVPRRLDQEALEWADVAVSTCSEEVCPVTPGVRRISWVFDDPKNLPLERVREIRDEIKESVEQLMPELDAHATDS